MKTIPTAEAKLKANFYNGSFIEIHSGDLEDIKNIMIEFAKLHVEAALKEASEKAKTIRDKEFFTLHTVSKSSILNAYSLTNIK